MMSALLGRCAQFLLRKKYQLGLTSKLSSVRMKSKVGCSDPREKCKKMKKSPCGPPTLQAKKRKQKKKKKFVSMWQDFPCDESIGPCPVNPRFDQLYYRESDKANRRYWQTWVSCPRLVIKPRKVCINKPGDAPRQRRKVKKPKYTHTKCQPVSKCPLIPNKCRRKGRCPPTCPRTTQLSGCKKIEAPFPAFSECVRLKPCARPLSECVCWNRPMLCEVWAEFRKRNALKMIR